MFNFCKGTLRHFLIPPSGESDEERKREEKEEEEEKVHYNLGLAASGRLATDYHSRIHWHRVGEPRLVEVMRVLRAAAGLLSGTSLFGFCPTKTKLALQSCFSLKKKPIGRRFKDGKSFCQVFAFRLQVASKRTQCTKAFGMFYFTRLSRSLFFLSITKLKQPYFSSKAGAAAAAAASSFGEK
ncbi:hypothetical protein M0802_003231 [Mischocyttarus mexicanus]|nr:hypothetical protein M0802_003231 [Mischocyttarus mexicanus]